MHWFSLSAFSLYIFIIYFRLKYLSLILDLHTFSDIFSSSLKLFPSFFCLKKKKKEEEEEEETKKKEEKKKEKKRRRQLTAHFVERFSPCFHAYLAFSVDILLTYLSPSALASQPHVHLPSHPFRVSVLCFLVLPNQRVENQQQESICIYPAVGLSRGSRGTAACLNCWLLLLPQGFDVEVQHVLIVHCFCYRRVSMWKCSMS